MQQERQFATLKNLTNESVTTFYCGVPTAHVGTNCQDFFWLKANEILKDDNRLICVFSTGKFFINLINLFFIPLPSLFILDIPKALFVVVDFTKVVHQRNNCDCFLAIGAL